MASGASRPVATNRPQRPLLDHARKKEVALMSKMREAMWSQPEQLARLLADAGPAEAAATRLQGRRRAAVGIGTSWHAAHHGAWMLREAGVEAEPRARRRRRALRPRDLARGRRDRPQPHRRHGLLDDDARAGARGRRRDAAHLRASATAASSRPSPPRRPTPTPPATPGRSLRLAQIATALGAQLGPLDGHPRARRRACSTSPAR